ncbi:tetratricopeptide repeat-containing sulfotransferase family protein [Hirschia baltica]|uniref:TPR repeat-containing protein n=1 Tax=Hirschia baltica (strain ATCC 49814 / DSM 5838 / IFAM 1418) TaxID=582402 RepID=C6XQ77_HIRBI|nr:sulfotransferase [Hirschia baltica]ACT58594.1 TPR repeat-containing protein [Hirschia baltica ATCC 49814]
METETLLPAKLKEIQEALENNNRNKAARLLTEQAKDLPEETVHRLGLAQLAATIGETATTRFYATHAVAGDSSSNTALKAATLLADVGDYPNAIKMAHRVVKTAKDFAPGWNILGTLQAQQGQFAEAEESLKKAIFIQPKSAIHWLELATIHNFTPDDPIVKDLLKLQSTIGSTSQTNQGIYLYALSKMMRDLGETEQAWHALNVGANLMNKAAPYDKENNRKNVDDILASIRQNTFAQLKPSPDTSNRAIFVFGNLRSGGTLIQRMLVGHPDVAGGDSTGLFSLAAATLKGVSSEELLQLQSKYENPWRDMAAAYYHMIKSRFGAEGRIVDRTLAQARLAPIIHHAMPKAPLIWIRRNIEDTAYSQFKTCFANGGRWSFNQENLGEHLAQEEKLFEAIAPSLGDALLIVNYEDLVANPEAERARIYAHCGLDASAEIQPTHAVPNNPIVSSSIVGISKPIYTDAIGKGAANAQYMSAFKTAYAAAKA